MSVRAHQNTSGRLRAIRSGEAGFSLIETLVAMAITAIVLGAVGVLMHLYAVAGSTSSAQDQASRQLKVADGLMSTDVGRAQLISAVPAGFDAAGSTPNQVWESTWKTEGKQVVRYTWTGSAGTAYPGPSGITAVGKRQVVANGVDAATTRFTYFNSAGGQLTPDGHAVAADAVYLAGATQKQKTSTAISRVAWDLSANPGDLVKLRSPVKAVTAQGGNSKANPATPIATTALVCPSPLLAEANGLPTLRWIDVGGVDHYAISRDGTVITAPPIAANAGDYSFTDVNAPTAKTSQYAVQILVDAGRKDIPTCGAVLYVPAPKITGSYSKAAGTFSASWPAITGVSSYTCYLQKLDYATGNPAGDWSEVSSGPGTSCSTPAADGDEGQFKVIATAPSIKAGGPAVTSGDSNIVKVLASPAAPVMLTQNFAQAAVNTVANPAEFPAPGAEGIGKATALDGSAGNGANTVHWYATAATTAYQVFGNTDGAGNALLATVTQPSGAVPGGTVVDSPAFTAPWGSTTVYSVRAYNTVPNSGGSLSLSAASNTKSVLQYPPAPKVNKVGVGGTADGNGINVLTWALARSADAAHAGGYHIVRGFNGAMAQQAPTMCLDTANCTQNTGGVTSTSYTDKAVPAGSRFNYAVRAYNKTGMSAGVSSTAVITQHAAAPPITTTNAPDLDSNTSGLTSPQDGDAGNPATYAFCVVQQQACRYRLLRDGVVVLGGDNAPLYQQAGATSTWSYNNAYGQDYNFQVQVYNGATYNGGWSPVGTTTATACNSSGSYTTMRICTYPAPFDINKIPVSTAQDAKGSGSQYTWQSTADNPLADKTPAAVVVTWGASQGDTLTYRYRAWQVGQASGTWDVGFSASRSTAAIPISDGGYTYNIQVQARAANGLTRGGNDPTVTADCSSTDPTVNNPTQCTAAFQSSPLLPARIGLVQQYVDGNNYYGHAYWGVKYYVAGGAIAGGSYANYDIAFCSTSRQQDGSAGATIGSGGAACTSWHNGGTNITGVTATDQFKGNKAEFDFYVQTRSTRTGVLNATTYSQMVKVSLASGRLDPWAYGGSGVEDASYGSGATDNCGNFNYQSSCPTTVDPDTGKHGAGGFVRYTVPGDPWAVRDDQSSNPPRPGTSWTAW